MSWTAQRATTAATSSLTRACPAPRSGPRPPTIDLRDFRFTAPKELPATGVLAVVHAGQQIHELASSSRSSPPGGTCLLCGYGDRHSRNTSHATLGMAQTITVR